MLNSWQFWAVASAAFAALTAIFAKIGVENIASDLATLIRTIVILAVAAAIVAATGQWRPPGSISGRTYAFLALSGMATGASWLCYFRALKLGEASRVAPIDKLSVVMVAAFGVLFLGERLSAWNWIGGGVDRGRRCPGRLPGLSGVAGRKAMRGAYWTSPHFALFYR